MPVSENPSNPGEGVYVLDWERDADDPTVAKLPLHWNHEYREELEPKRVRFALKGQVADRVRRGKRAVRFEIRRADRNNRNVWRAELAAQPPESPPAERWYGFSIYLPKNWVNDSNGIIVTQWHQQDSEAAQFQGTPPLAIMTKVGKWCINTRQSWDNTVSGEADVRPLHTAGSPDGSYAPDLGKWTDWVVYAKWSAGADGELKIWKNGQPLLLDDRARGQNKFDDGKSNYFKIGLYKWTWPETASQKPDRVMYHDEVRIAAGSADHYKDVSPFRSRRRIAPLR